jgi:hypothetical protein
LVSGVGVTFGVLAVIAFVLRIAAKITRSGGTLGADDYVMFIAVVGFAYPGGFLTIVIIMVVLNEHGYSYSPSLWLLCLYHVSQYSSYLWQNQETERETFLFLIARTNKLWHSLPAWAGARYVERIIQQH